jgi:hypothetical protein
LASALSTRPLIVFDLLIPRTDDRTGLVHPPPLFDEWTLETAERFGGISCLAVDLLGFWFDKGDLVEDHSNLYRIAVPDADVDALRDHVKATALRFGQRCLYLQRSGEAELVWPDPE